MSLDLTLLRLGKHRKQFNRLNPGLPEKGLAGTTLLVWRALRAFYVEFPDVNTIDIPSFKTWFTEFKHQAMEADMVAVYSGIIDGMAADVPKDVEEGLMERILTSELSVEVLTLLETYTNGDDVDLLEGLRGRIVEYEDRMARKTKLPLVTETVDELMQEDEHDLGVSWRLHALRTSMRKQRGGDFGIWATRPDRGKTTSMASESSYWTPQLPPLWPDRHRVGIWFNNEGPGKRIKLRYYQAALGCTMTELVAMHKDGKLIDKLKEVLGEDYQQRMLFYDIHDYYSHEVEAIIRQHDPAFLIFDMIDNIRFSGATSNNGQRTDQMLEEMYKWGRNLCVKHDCFGVAMSQISGDGDGVPYPSQANLKDSKTGKQGACDWIVMLGALNDPGMDRSRFLGIPKNKLSRDDGPKNPQVEVVFDAPRARLCDPE